MTRRHIATRERLEIFTRTSGVCHICGGRIDGVREAWEVEHIIPLAQGGDDHGDNLAPAHVKCHRAKTSVDATNTARAKRREAAHIGAKAPSRNPMPGSKASGLRKRMNGTVERRS
jgi:5-methylcytosine-specific restriction enzyme A